MYRLKKSSDKDQTLRPGGRSLFRVRVIKPGKVIELDRQQLLTLIQTLNCICCKDNENAQVMKETIDTINEQLQENNIARKVDRYYVCLRRKSPCPKVLEQTLSDRY